MRLTQRTSAANARFLAVLAFFFAAYFSFPPGWSVAYGAAAEYVPGELIVKFKTSLSRVPRSGAAVTGMPSVDRLSAIHRVVRMEKLLDKHERNVNKGKLANLYKHGLDRIHRLEFPDDADIEQAASEFADDPNVEYAEPNYILRTNVMPNDPSFSQLYGLHNTGQSGGTPDADIDAPAAWDIQTGSTNVVIAVIDTGVDYNHEDLAANIWSNQGEIPGNGIDDDGNGFVDDIRGWDFVNDDNNPSDDNGHGTHVAGTIGAVGNNGKGVAGVNWNVKIMPLKFLDSDGFGFTSDAIGAIQYATLMGAHITNNSWGGAGFSQALEDAISAANDAGILFVAAAGNGGLDGVGDDNDFTANYPSNYEVPNVIAVAATNRNDQRASFSNYGATTVHLGAPGVSIFSTVPTGACDLCDPSGYLSLSGTSMATPQVAGVAGLIKAEFPALTSTGIKARLLATVNPIPSLNGITVTGGRLNALAAVDSIPPDSVIDNGPANLTKSTSAFFTFHSTQPGSSFQCQLDGGGFSACGSPKTYNGLADGIHTFEIQATDSAGNTDPVAASWQWTVDATAPMNVQVTAPVGGQTIAGTYTLTATADDNSGAIQKMEFYIDAGTSPVCYDNLPKASGSTFQCNWNSAVKPDGSRTVTAKAYDAAGNVSSSGALAFNLDNIVMTVLSPNGSDNWTVGSTQTIQWSLTGIGGRVRIHISRDGGVTWKRIARRTLNDGVFSWTVTNSSSTQARIRACSVKNPTVCDTSDADFTIQ